MRKVLEKVVDKNGATTIRFSPTAHMRIFAMEKAKNPGAGDRDVCREAGLDPQCAEKWAERYGSHYLEWLEEFIEQTPSGKEAALLERVGMVQALEPGNFQYWRELARTHGVIKEEVREQKITINTDFSQILIAGEDFEDARRRILQKYRGVVDAREPRVVDVTRKREQASPGDGTGDLQKEPLALDHALGEDGGHAKQGEPVSALSGKNSPPSHRRNLGKRKIPSHS